MRATNRQHRFAEGKTKEAKSGDAAQHSPLWPTQSAPSCSGAPMRSPAAPKTHPKRPNWRQSSCNLGIRGEALATRGKSQASKISFGDGHSPNKAGAQQRMARHDIARTCLRRP
jgi:hypothetical protein